MLELLETFYFRTKWLALILTRRIYRSSLKLSTATSLIKSVLVNSKRKSWMLKIWAHAATIYQVQVSPVLQVWVCMEYNAHLKHRNHLNSINISLRAEPSCRDLVREACRGGTGEKRRKEGSILKVRQKPLLLRSDEVNSHWLKISVVSRITRPLYILAVKIFVARVQTQF